MSRKNTVETARTRNNVLIAARSIFYRHGVNDSTLEMIAKKAGLTRGAIYWHFKNKQALAEEICQSGLLRLEDFLAQRITNMNSPDSLAQILCELIRYVVAHPEISFSVHILNSSSSNSETNGSLYQLRIDSERWIKGIISQAISHEITNEITGNKIADEYDIYLATKVIFSLMITLLLELNESKEQNFGKFDKIIHSILNAFNSKASVCYCSTYSQVQ